MQNGVDNVARMRGEGVDALGAVVYVGASMAGPGHLLHAGRGDLVIGEYGPVPAPDPLGSGSRAARVAAIFESAGVKCVVEADVRAALWKKLVMNCAFNAMSAIGRARYGTLVDRADTRELLASLVGECVEVAKAEGIALGSTSALIAEALELGRAMSPAISSTAQDLIAGRPTEIDSLNGHVAARGQALGVATPANAALAAMVRLIESADSYASQRPAPG
jgi:2-dehydropantoate 2-reductase